MPLSVKKIATSILCPEYTPHVEQKSMRKHEKLLEHLYVTLANKGLICAKRVNISGDFYGYKVNGVIDLLCYNPRDCTIHIYEVKSKEKGYPSHLLQTILYAIILIKRAYITSITKKIMIHVLCEDHEISFRLVDCPIKYLLMLMESLEKLEKNIRTTGPWCKYCRNRISCIYSASKVS